MISRYLKKKGDASRPLLSTDCRVFDKLPVEIWLTIVDYLRAWDAVALELAIGWTIGNAYWCARISTSVFPEVKPYLHEALNWVYVCDTLERMVEREPPIPVRTYIVKALHELDEMVHQKLADRHRTI